MASRAKKLPGETAATVPPFNAVRVNNPAMFPRIGAMIVFGFDNTYGKVTSAIPPTPMIIVAAGADFFAIPFPQIANPRATPVHTPPLASTRNKMDFPALAACSTPIGIIIP